MELIKPVRPRRSQVTEVAYRALNVGLAVVILLVTLSTQNFWLPLMIVLLSKWRVLAVRPRYWRANVLANLVDIIVGLSYVVLLYQSLSYLPVQIGLTVAYIGWLLLIKPRSKRSFIVMQSLSAVFFGVTALAAVSYAVDVALFTVGIWVIGYAALRHIMMSYEEPLAAFLSLLGGLMIAQLGWFGYHWLFAYTVPSTSIHISQLAVIATLLVFMTERVYNGYHKHGDNVRMQDIVLPIVFTLLLVAIILLIFNQISPAGSL